MNKEPTYYRDPRPACAIGYIPAEAKGGVLDTLEQIGRYTNTYSIPKARPVAKVKKRAEPTYVAG